MDPIDLKFGNPNAAYLVIFVVFIAAIGIWSAIASRSARSKFASGAVGEDRIPRGSTWISMCLSILGLTFLCFALTDFRWGKADVVVQQQGLEVMFILDVSKSMLARDASPDRLTRAKQQIKDIVNEMAGDRIGLVAFAGGADQLVPMTKHYSDFTEALDLASPDSIQLGGSQLGEAIKEAGKGFMSKTNGHKTIVIFTDGEDHESNPVAAAKALHQETGARIFTIGLGDVLGSLVPDIDPSLGTTYVRHDGEPVRSKLNGKILQQIADSSNATYIPAGTRRVNMADFYHRFVANVDKQDFESAKFKAYLPRFQWFAFVGFLLLVSEAIWSTRSRRTNKRAPAVVSVALFAVFANSMLSPSLAIGQTTADTQQQNQRSVAKQINQANQLIADGKSPQAVKLLSEMDETVVDAQGYVDQRDYNLGVAYYRGGDLESAASYFANTARSKNTDIAARSRYNLGNTLYSQAMSSLFTPDENQSGEGQSASSEKLERVKQNLKQAISSYRSALRIQPNSEEGKDARANIEVAYQALKELQEAEEQEPDSQDQQNKEQEENQDQEENKEQQESADQNQDNSDQQDQENKEQQEDGQQEDDQQEDGQQQGDNQQQENQSGEPGESEPQDGNSDAGDQPNDKNDPKSGENQQDQSGENDGDQSQENQNQPEQSGDKDDGTGEDEAPIDGELKSAGDDKEGPPPQPSLSGQARDTAKISKGEALKMLQALRDREMERKRVQLQRARLIRERLRNYRQFQVEKDW